MILLQLLRFLLYKCEGLCGIICWLFWTIFSSIKWDRLPHMHLKDFAFKDGISNEVNHLTFYVLWETWFDEHGCLILIWWLRFIEYDLGLKLNIPKSYKLRKKLQILQWVKAMKWGVRPELLFHEGGYFWRETFPWIFKSFPRFESDWQNFSFYF